MKKAHCSENLAIRLCLIALTLTFSFISSQSYAQTLVDLTIESQKKNDCNPLKPDESVVFTIPGKGKLKIVISKDPYVNANRGGIEWHNVPGSTNLYEVPGKTLEYQDDPNPPVEGRSWKRTYIQQVERSENVRVRNIAPGYKVGVGPGDCRQLATRQRVVVDFLGSGDDGVTTGNVDITGTWRHGAGGETWTFTSKGDGTYTAVEKGFGNAKGTATVKGNKVRVDYVTANGQTTGVYEVTVSTDGKTASGTCKDSQHPAGNGTSWTRITGGSSVEPPDVDRMTLAAAKRKAKPGETVTVPVYLIKGVGVADMNFNVTFNASVAQATQAAKGSLIPAATLFEANTGQAGNVRMGFAGTKDFGGTGPVAQLTFKAVGKPGARTPLRVVVTNIGSASGAKPSIATIDGEIEIVGGTSATTTSTTTTSPTTTTTTTTPPPKEIKGDCDGNGTLNTLDAMCALDMSVGLIPVNLRTDMDNDGKVTSTDARLIMQKSMGK